MLAVAVAVAGGVISSLSVSLRYLHAKPLSVIGGGWLPPDNAHARFVTAGPYSATVIRPRPGHWQTFELDVIYTSDVSQTVLSIPDAETLADPRLSAEPQMLQMSTTSAYPASGKQLHYTSGPVTSRLGVSTAYA